MNHLLLINVEKVEDVTVITPKDEVGDVDDRLYLKFFDEVNETVDEASERVVIDLTGINTMASAAIGKLITLQKTTNSSGKKLMLCISEEGPIDEALTVTTLKKKFFTVRHTRDEALAELGDS